MDPAGNFVGVNICIHSDKENGNEKGRKALFLPRMLLRQRLEQYEILTYIFFASIIMRYTLPS